MTQYTTQMDAARQGIITPQMEIVAEKEHFDVEELRELIAKGRLDRLRRTFRRYQTLIVSVSVVLFSCTGALIVPFVRLYTKGITDATTYSRCLR